MIMMKLLLLPEAGTCDHIDSYLMQFSRCFIVLGRNEESVDDASKAVEINTESFQVREALGKAFYSAGCFEHALLQFYKANR